MRFAGAVRPILLLVAMGVAPLLHADPPAVEFNDGLLTIRCADAPLDGLLDQVKDATGITLILEGSAAGTRLTARVESLPVSMAIPRLLEGTGIDYALVADRRDPRRVATLYVGAGKSAATPGAARGPAVSPSARAGAAEPAPAVEAPAVEEPPAVEESSVGSEPDDGLDADIEPGHDRPGRGRRPGRETNLRRSRPASRKQPQ
jgi:hypothetical protein